MGRGCAADGSLRRIVRCCGADCKLGSGPGALGGEAQEIILINLVFHRTQDRDPDDWSPRCAVQGNGLVHSHYPEAGRGRASGILPTSSPAPTAPLSPHLAFVQISVSVPFLPTTPFRTLSDRQSPGR